MQLIKFPSPLTDETADYEDIKFELELLFDADHINNSSDMGYILRKKSFPFLFMELGRYFLTYSYLAESTKIIKTLSKNNSDYSKKIKFTGTYKGFNCKKNIEVIAPISDGLLHGKCMHFYKNRIKKSESSFLKGIKHGISKEFYENGKLKIITNWRNGKRHGMKYVFNQNNLIAIYIYKEGKLIEKK